MNKIDVLDRRGGDLSIVRNARVSYDAERRAGGDTASHAGANQISMKLEDFRKMDGAAITSFLRARNPQPRLVHGFSSRVFANQYQIPLQVANVLLLRLYKTGYLHRVSSNKGVFYYPIEFKPEDQKTTQ